MASATLTPGTNRLSCPGESGFLISMTRGYVMTVDEAVVIVNLCEKFWALTIWLIANASARFACFVGDVPCYCAACHCCRGFNTGDCLHHCLPSWPTLAIHKIYVALMSYGLLPENWQPILNQNGGIYPSEARWAVTETSSASIGTGSVIGGVEEGLQTRA